MKNPSLFSLLTIFLFWGCASNPSIQTNLVLDINMPLFGVNDFNPPSSFKLIKKLSVSSTDVDETTAPLGHALRIEAANIGANSVLNVTVKKERFNVNTRFGSIIPKVKTIMTGEAVFAPQVNQCVNTVILEAIYHKHKNYEVYRATKGLSSSPHMFQELIENGNFYLSKNGTVNVVFEDYEGDSHSLSISQEEIRDFKNSNINISYRLKPSGVKLE